MTTTKRWRARGLAALMLAAQLTGGVGAAYAAPAPAGSVIGNQASATYTDALGTVRTTTSNLVQTTVSQVKVFALTNNGARTAAPGQTVYYPHTITNLGNGSDTFALNTPSTAGDFTHTGLAYFADANGDGVPDNATPITTSGPISAGATFKFVLAGVVPAAAVAGQNATITIGVSDTGGNTQNNTDTTTVAASVITVTKSMSSTSGPSPSGPITVTLNYTNTGTSAATNLSLLDPIAQGLTYVPGSARWSGSGSTVLNDTGASNPAGITYDYGVTVASRVSAIIGTVPAGSSGTLTFQVNVNGGLAPTNNALGTSCTSAGCPALTTNVATYSTSTQASTSTNSVTFMVQQVGAVVANGSATVSTNGTGEPISVASSGQGSVVMFPVQIWNTGNGSDSFDVTVTNGSFPAGTTFSLLKSDAVTTLIDTNGNAAPDTGPVAPAGRYTVYVAATLPGGGTTGNNGGAGFTATVSATSRHNAASSDTAIVNLGQIVANSVDLTADTSVAGGAAAGDGLGATGATVIRSATLTPGASAVIAKFALYANNTGVSADSYNMNATGVPAGWSIGFYHDGGAGDCSTLGAALSNTGGVAGGANKLVCAQVSVPPISSGQAAPGSFPIGFTAVSASIGGLNDVLTASIVVNAVHAVTLTPNNTQQTYAGGAVTYSHTISNVGNVAETIAFAAGFLTDSQVAQGYTSAAYLDSNSDGILNVGTDTLISSGTTQAIPAQGTYTVFVRVFAPASATSATPANVSTLVATYNVTLNASATDTTSVTDGLVLQKGQKTVSCSNAGPHSGFTTAAIAAGPATAPGQCLAYEVTATNTTAQAITVITVSDTVPANTVLKTSCGAPAASGGATVGGTATDGSAGTVTASLASLSPGASFAMSFCVQINP